MKIVLACRVYPTHRSGGMPFVCRDRAVALAEAGHTVHVLTTSHDKYKDPCEIDGVTVWHLDSLTRTYSENFAIQCVRVCKALNPDIIHTDSVDVNRQWWTDFKCRKALTLHGFCWGAFLTQWNLYKLGQAKAPVFDAAGMLKEREVFNTFDTVIGVSLHEHWMLRDLFGLSQAQLVYNPIPAYFFDPPFTSPPNTRRFICAAVSGQTERQFSLAKQAAQELDVQLAVVSGKTREQMPAVYDLCTALVVPTAYAQGYDLTVAEALARRRPVIASATGSYYRESAYESGIYLTELGSKESLKEAMRLDFKYVDQDAADIHRPYNHVRFWLEAVCS